MGPSTQAVHGERHANPYHSVAEPIVQTATYTFEDTADLSAFMEARMWGREANGRSEYGRYGNPTVTAVEQRLAALEDAGAALLFSSGMAAISTVLLAMLPTGGHIVITDDCYRRTREFCLKFLKRLGITCSVVPMGDHAAIEAAIQDNTRLLISESPTNPYLRVLDLENFVAIAKKHRVKTLVDATFATPLNQRPLDFGVDIVVHSATKYLAGHNDLLAGVVLGEEGLIASFKNALGVMGAVADPHNAALLLRGLKTLGLRIERQNTNGQAVGEFLEAHPAIEQVWYPGLASHPDHAVAAQQMQGFGGVVSFTVKGDLQTTSRFIDALQIPLMAASLGGVETLVEQPALMSFYELSTEERLEIGIRENLVRLALGIEDTDDLIADLDQALAQI
ncbi:MAG: aminotransferase class I/II-fold pyridoxal phosphate-dependent enzyme [Chloroflexi bacterium]|nr:MAG: aminotransferase class I/II-fold pyridoxal phosphate-dependent enzyme [Chloroflexota bacterium]MBL1197438.1 aminotransferase class I/II-fold pyridoxal phosphate-dependent enzyme [Chloroflexota bacterium]NOH14733.1 aminotransferase class I/II-fold pyridoxal phosphate-dependent enzyme [Chloroflexota bacterium]